MLHIKLRRAMLGTHLREEQGNKEASTQTDRLPAEAGTPPPLRSQASAQTPRQRAQSVLQTQPKACHRTNNVCYSQGCVLNMNVGWSPPERGTRDHHDRQGTSGQASMMSAQHRPVQMRS